jgi:hypothetical protein
VPDEPEFRVGDMAPEFSRNDAPAAASRPGIDVEAFPTLAAWMRLSKTELRERVDQLAGRARQESSQEVQKALQTAAQVLQSLHTKHGG